MCHLGSIPPLASLVGSLIAGPCLTMLGRRTTLMLISIPYSIGFLLIGFASHSSMLYIGRILDGAMIGFSAPSAQIFVSSIVIKTGTLGMTVVYCCVIDR